MFAGKTRNGVSIKSTQGMKSPTPGPTWILVADRSRLRLFQQQFQSGFSELEIKKEFDFPDGRKKGHELVADRPGRSFDSQDQTRHGQTGGTRHSYGDKSLPTDRVTDRLVEKAAKLLEEGRTGHRFDRAVLVAEPKLMGLLREALGTFSTKMSLTFHEKDFAWLQESALKERLMSLL